VDQGNPLPDEKLPAGAQVDVSGPVNTLPEGGFGWFLIRTLSDRLEYRRVASENHLSIWFSLSSDAAIRHSVDK